MAPTMRSCSTGSGLSEPVTSEPPKVVTISAREAVTMRAEAASSRDGKRWLVILKALRRPRQR